MAAGVFVVGVYFLNYYQVRRNAGFFLEQAASAEQEAKLAHDKSDKRAERKAIEEQLNDLAWFIRLVPKDPRCLDVQEEYGMLMADNIRDSSSFGAAYQNLEQVVVKDPERSKARRKLIDLWMRPDVNRFIDARPHIEAFLAKKPDDPEMLTLLGRCQSATDENKKAKAAFLDAIKYSPQQFEAYFYLAMLLQDHPELCDKPDSSGEQANEGGPEAKAKAVENTPESVMARMMEKNPDSAKAHNYMCQYLMQQKATAENRKEALRHAERSLELDPGDRDVLFGRRNAVWKREIAKKGAITRSKVLIRKRISIGSAAKCT